VSELHPARPWLRAFALALSLCACSASEDEAKPMPNPIAGLYAPGSALGASDPTDVPLPGAGLGERCVAPPLHADDAGVAAGSLQVTYQTQSVMGLYAPKNCTAAWIETVDGAYVATLELAAALRKPGLVYFQEHACVEELGPDVVASATLLDHKKPHMLEWSGVDFKGLPMPDGPYKLFIEVTETDKEPGDLATFDIMKGGTFTADPAVPEGPLVSVHVAWMAGGGKSGFP
jgi:hypothetical protein